MIEAGYRLFSSYGYAVPMEEIAKQAGVAVQTLHFTFHTKANLMKGIIDFASTGGDEFVPVMERPWVKEVEAAGDPRRALALIVENGVDIFRRLAPLIPAVQSAISVDPDLAEYWEALVAGRRRGMRHMIGVLADKGWLDPKQSVDRAADILFVVQSPEALASFTGLCAWTLEQYKAWLYATLRDQFLAQHSDPQAGDPEADPLAGLSFATLLAPMTTRATDLEDSGGAVGSLTSGG
jgi:AcrR family transcriptional regulator